MHNSGHGNWQDITSKFEERARNRKKLERHYQFVYEKPVVLTETILNVVSIFLFILYLQAIIDFLVQSFFRCFFCPAWFKRILTKTVIDKKQKICKILMKKKNSTTIVRHCLPL